MYRFERAPTEETATAATAFMSAPSHVPGGCSRPARRSARTSRLPTWEMRVATASRRWPYPRLSVATSDSTSRTMEGCHPPGTSFASANTEIRWRSSPTITTPRPPRQPLPGPSTASSPSPATSTASGSKPTKARSSRWSFTAAGFAPLWIPSSTSRISPARDSPGTTTRADRTATSVSRPRRPRNTL